MDDKKNYSQMTLLELVQEIQKLLREINKRTKKK